MNIVAALDDRALFAGLLDGPSWRPWRVFLAALFGLPMDDVQLALYRHHTGRSTPPLTPFREAALVVGRRGGKSRILALVATFLACVPDHALYTAPGETPVVAIIAADRKQARIILSYIVGLLHAVPALETMIGDELTESVRLTNGVTIEVHTGSIGAPRGRTFIAVLADEIAFWDTGDAANPDREIIGAVRPGLATLPNSILLMASSPYARRGVLFDTFARYFGRDDAPVLVWRGTTREINSQIDPRIIEEAFEADPESAAAEYNAEFRSDITAFIGRDAVEAVVADDILELPPAAGLSYAAFVDPSGGSADSMTLAIAHVGGDGVAVLDALRERKPPFSPEDVTTEFSELLRSYGITRVQGDAYAGEWPRERFATHGISYEVSPRNKNTIYQDFLPALNGRRVRLLDQSRLIAQLCNLERRVSRGGRDSIDHGPGQHDDLANCVCGVLTQVINDRRPALIRQSDMTIGGKPVPMPTICDVVFATLAVNDRGQTAAVYSARSIGYGIPLILLDYDASPLSSSTFDAIHAQLEAYPKTCRVRYGSLGLYAAEPLARQASARGFDASALPSEMVSHPASVALSAAAHVASGDVKISVLADEKARTSPLGGALDFRGGDTADDPLRAAVLYAVAAGLDDLAIGGR